MTHRRSEPPVRRLYVRFQAAVPDRHGRFPGVFALVDGLSAAGLLTETQERFRRTGNAWFREHLVNPYEIDRRVYDRDRHPGAAAWFKSGALPVLDRVGGFLRILDRHEIAWERLDTDDPGTILYDDPQQIVALPQRAPG
ncbi:hypothetical protein [Nocardia thailandica]|uniref:hypothetical protein n=1 Tax=Nocardia thailandica TaxID=257275 RepID=UPI0003176F9D|nr:hypothetical protein [Nocardia thailandica]